MEHRTIYVLPIPELNNIGHKIANGRRVPSSNIVNAVDSTVENDNSKLPFRTRVRNYFKPPYCTKCRRKLSKSNTKTSESLSSTSPSSTKNSWLACCRKQPEPDTEPIVKDSQRPSEVSNGSRREMDSVSSDKQRTCCMKFKDLICCSRKNKVRDLGTEPQGCCGRLKCWKKKQDDENWAERRDSILSDAPPKKCCPISRCWPFCRRSSETGSTTEPDSRRTSMNDKKKSLTPTTLPPEKRTPVLDESLVEHTSEMRGAIPVLPIPLAWFCLILNCILPGVGTVISGLLCLCFGKPRFSVHDGARLRLGSFIINLIVGVSQLFCVLFCLVGWGWSIWWGVIMLRVSRKYKKMKMSEATMEEDAPSTAPTNQNHNARDVERGRT